MPDSKKEQVLKAFFSALQANIPVGATLVRNQIVPTRIPAGGWVCLGDGDPGQPEFLFSPPTYIYDHSAEVDVVVEGDDQAARDALFDTLTQAVGSAIAADRTLGGLCDYALGAAPAPVELEAPGTESMKAATIGVILTYGSSDPLA
ncbi:acyl-CoA transferase [Leisingera daeponensis]|uniref:acyl-CoA transferase n=1 Tax=Leisingera daeponensis TaxID=405746 RepID=UPI0028F6DB89|nr:acyl-CoA transferase [Leisingera daeponensis]